MNQKTSPSDKHRSVSASRHGHDIQTTVKKPRSEIGGNVAAVKDTKGKSLIGSGGVGVTDHSNHRPKEAESRAGRCDPVMRNFNPPRESKVKVLSSVESENLLASHSIRRPVFITIKKKPVVVNALMKKKKKKKKDTNADVSRLRENVRKPTQHRDETSSTQRGLVSVPKGRVNVAVKNHPIQAPKRVEADQDQDQDGVVAALEPNGQEEEIAREKVLEVLSFFKQVYKRLDQEKEARRGGDLFQATSRIDIKTLAVIEKMGRRVNMEKRIGSVPGIKVGDEFQYKSQLRAVGLHSRQMNGIDYMKVGDMKLATSIVATERYGYKNMFYAGVMVYTGEGGNVISTEGMTHDQKLTQGNLALVNSFREKSEVRVIRGEERWDRRSKRYIYFGLYIVDKYWTEKEDRGNKVYKFQLLRIPGQAPILT